MFTMTVALEIVEHRHGTRCRRRTQNPNCDEIDVEFATTQLATGAFPRFTEVFGSSRIEANKDRFGRGLRALLEGIQTSAVAA